MTVFFNRFQVNFFSPNLKARTTDIMVPIVTTEKSTDTIIVPDKLSWAAGYINKGIRGSQGPKTNIIKSIQGVVLTTSLS
jgi:hypothetical protein